MKRPLTRREVLSGVAPSGIDALVHIASLLVHATPAACQMIKATLIDPHIEIHDTEHPRKLAIVLESADDRVIADIASQVQDIAGVISVSVVAHLVESERSLREDYRRG